MEGEEEQEKEITSKENHDESPYFNLKNKIELFEKDIQMYQTEYLKEKERVERERIEKSANNRKNKYLYEIIFLFRSRDS
jgi:hypothetical protein